MTLSTLIIIGFIFVFLSASMRVLKEYERGVIFTLGRYTRVAGPGIIIVIPVLQQMVRSSLRTIVMNVPPQDVITRDNVSVKVNAVVYFRVIEPERTIIQVQNYYDATSQLAQTTLRSVVGEHELDQLLSEREKLNLSIQKALDSQTSNWGIKVNTVEIKDIDLNENMVRALAKQAEAERDRRAKIIHAEGELQASVKLREAADELSKSPQALQLRYLQTAIDISNENTNTLIFPIPMDIFSSLMNRSDKS